MNKNYTFLKIPFFPYEPSVEQVIFVERGYNQLFNSVLSKIHYKDDKTLYLPSVERKFHQNVSADTFFSETLLQIDDLYSFLEDAKVGTLFTDAVSFESDPFEVYDQSVDDVVQYGIINYTGKICNGAPIFTYCSLVSGTEDEFYERISSSIDTFIYVHNRLAFEKANLTNPKMPSMEYIVVMDRNKQWKPEDYPKNFYEFREKYHNMGNVTYHVGKGEKLGASKNRADVWKVKIDIPKFKNDMIYYPEFQLTPIQLAIYSFFIYQEDPINISYICSTKEELDVLETLYNDFQRGNRTKATFGGDMMTKLHREIDKINNSIELGLMKGVSKNNPHREEIKARRCNPYMISRFIDEGYGILVACRGRQYRKFVSDYRSEIDPLISDTYSKKLRNLQRKLTD